ncbi:hypothetical protein HZA85_02210 [Candidatus Uhrbacteria bacterium]|nr:hypothetical protein [Candidatus Uhrbacteria bacterium]
MIPRRKKRRSSRQIKQELRAIYSGRDGKLPDFTRLSQRKRSPLTAFLIKTIGILFVLSLLAWGGFFLFTRGLFENGESLKASIELSEPVRAGEETVFTIRYENTGDVPIASLNLKLNLPNSFHLTSAIPEPAAELQWSLGALTARSDGAINVKGIFLSPVPSTQRIQALFSYKPANFNSEFQTIESQSVDLKESSVHLTMTGPEKALAGDPVEYTLNLEQTGKDPVFNLRVVPVFPADFVIDSSVPPIKPDDPSWDIVSLEPGKITDIVIKGAFTSTANGELPMQTKVSFMDEETFNEQASANVQTDVLGGAVSFHLILDGSDKDQNVSAGKTLRGSIDFKNPGTDPVEDVQFTLKLSSQGKLPVDWAHADLSDASRSDGTLHWDKTKHKELARLDPGVEGVIDFTLPLIVGGADAMDAALSMAVGKIGTLSGTHTIDATPVHLSMNSDASLSVQARYFADDGTPVGGGDLPPKVGSTTSYRMLFDLSNALHDLGNIDVTTTLPQDVTWKESSGKDIGVLSYNPTTRQVRWEVSKLPRDIRAAQAWFNVSITPKKGDVGKFVKLANQTLFHALDLSTKAELNATVPLVTTELAQDEFAQGKGAVKP